MKSIRLVLGSIFVYLMVGTLHACSSPGGMSTATGGTGGTADAGILDALTDPVSEANADSVSGSRLKAYYVNGEDGSKASMVDRWYDSERFEDCSFRTMYDGSLRCIPVDKITEANVYADAGCTKPVLKYKGGCLPTKYTTATTYDYCSGTPKQRIYPTMEQVSVQVYFMAPNGCTVAGVAPGVDYFATGPEILPSSFVAGTMGHD